LASKERGKRGASVTGWGRKSFLLSEKSRQGRLENKGTLQGKDEIRGEERHPAWRNALQTGKGSSPQKGGV